MPNTRTSEDKVVNRVKMYLPGNRTGKVSPNSENENDRLSLFRELFYYAKAAQESNETMKPEYITKCRKAYKGILNSLNKQGFESPKRSRRLDKSIFEAIESMTTVELPGPKMSAASKEDIPLIRTTEDFLKFQMNNHMNQYMHQDLQKAVPIDGTAFMKISWDPFNKTYDRSGDIRLDLRTLDQIVCQPGVRNYKNWEYIFEIRAVSISEIYDLYGKMLINTQNDRAQESAVNGSKNTTNVTTVVSCYYLNADRVVGHFMWQLDTDIVIADEEDWMLRKVRRCTLCDTINPVQTVCKQCGNTTFKYKPVEYEFADKDYMKLHIEYVADKDEQGNVVGKHEKWIKEPLIEKEEEIPVYRIRQLPFVPVICIKDIESIFGISLASLLLDNQDMNNKLLNKIADKVLKSGIILSKPETRKLADNDDTIKVMDVKTTEEASMIHSFDVNPNISQDIALYQMSYQNMKNISGVQDSYTGKADSTAESGKAKQVATLQTIGRLEPLRKLVDTGYAGIYELMFKFYLAFSDKKRKFIRVLPDGSEIDAEWDKYMFLDKDDESGELFYRDDFKFEASTTANSSNERSSMWQVFQQELTLGTLGNPSDPRTLELYWKLKDMYQFPGADIARTGIKENSNHLPTEVEQVLLQNPELVKQLMTSIQQSPQGSSGTQNNTNPTNKPGNADSGFQKPAIDAQADMRRQITKGDGQMGGAK